MTTTKKQVETAKRYKAMGWHEREVTCKCITLEKGAHKAKVLKNGKAVREVAHV